jgi:hypothetical protein
MVDSGEFQHDESSSDETPEPDDPQSEMEGTG